MKYWLMIDGTRLGPFTPEQVAMQPGVNADTPVWYTGMADWTVIANVPELASRISGPAVPPPPAPGANIQPPAPAPYGFHYPPQAEPCPANYLAWTIIVTLLCCTPLGIVAIIYSAGVNTAYSSGNLEAARRKSRLARNWTIVAAIAGLLCSIIYTIYIFSSGDLSAVGYNYDF